MKKFVRNIKSIVITVILVAVIFLSGVMYAKTHHRGNGTKVSDTTVKNALVSISELATSDYHYTKVGKFTNSLKLNGWTIPFTEKSFLLTYEGDIKAGYDLSDAKVSVSNKRITVTLPKVKVLENTISEKSIKVYDEKNNIFNSISVSDYKAFALKEKGKAKKEAIQNGLYQRAYKQASLLITTHIQALNNNYKVTIKQA